MVSTLGNSKIEVNEYVAIVEEFKQRLLFSLQKDQDNVIENAENEAKLILKKAYGESAGLVAEAREKIQVILDQAKEHASRETETTLLRAREEADQIIRNAEQTIRKEAKEKTRQEMESILSQARQNAAAVTNDTLKVAREAANKLVTEAEEHALLISQTILDEAKQKSEEIIRTSQELKERAAVELEKARKKTGEIIGQINLEVREAVVEKAEKQAAEILARAKVESQNERDALLAVSAAEAVKAAEDEKAQIIQQAQQEARQIIDAARMGVLAKISESNRLMQEIQEKMQQVIDTPVPPIIQLPEPQNSPAPVQQILDVPEPQDSPVPAQPILQVPEPQNTPAPVPESAVAPEPVAPKMEKKVKSASRTRSASGKNKSESQREVKPIEPGCAAVGQTYNGKLKIEIAAPNGRSDIAVFEEQLSQLPGMRILMNGGAQRGSAWIMVALSGPMVVTDILKQIPIVENAEDASGFVMVTVNSKRNNQ